MWPPVLPAEIQATLTAENVFPDIPAGKLHQGASIASTGALLKIKKKSAFILRLLVFEYESSLVKDQTISSLLPFLNSPKKI